MAAQRAQVTLLGPFAVHGTDGRDVTPKGAKARALIVLLADAPDGRRARRWIESKLWSDRSARQASGSLRQTLTEIRGVFGDDRDLLGADRLDVWLDRERITTDIAEGAVPADPDTEPLEGLDVRDPEFEDWLRSFRQRHLVRQPPPPVPLAGLKGLRVSVTTRADSTGPDRILAQALADQVGQNVEESLSALRIDASRKLGDIAVETDVSTDGVGRLVQVRVIHTDSARVLYSGYRGLADGDAATPMDLLIAEFAHDATNRTIAKIPQVMALDRPEVSAAGFSMLARKRLFTFRPDQMQEAEALMERAADAAPGGSYLGWLAFMRMTRAVESLDPIPLGDLEETESLLRQAEEAAPENGELFALNALTRLMLFDDTEAGLVAADAGLARNPNHLLVRQTLAVAAAAAGDHEAAYRMSAFCQPGLQRAEFRHLWELYHALVCIATGRLEEARQAAERAARACPDFRAPRRLLIALYAKRGEFETASRHYAILKKLEPGFNLDRFQRDPEYPVTTLRNAGLLAFPADALADAPRTAETARSLHPAGRQQR